MFTIFYTFAAAIWGMNFNLSPDSTQMIRVNKILFILVFITALLVGGSCHAPKQYVVTASVSNNLPVVVRELPEVDIPLPSYAHFDFIIPKTELKEVEYGKKNVTLDFTARDKYHVKANDPMLFSDGNTEIIDLAFLSEKDYAFPLPGAKVISPYAGRRKNHSGIDLKTHPNDTIVSAFDGIVRLSRSYAAYGNVIVIRHYNGLETVYSHSSKNLVKAGDAVKAGQSIALVGRTGRATTEHLHFETRINGAHFNPELVFDFESRTLQPTCLLCVKTGNSIKVRTVSPFPNHLVAL